MSAIHGRNSIPELTGGRVPVEMARRAGYGGDLPNHGGKMSEPSPSVVRIVAVLTFFIEHSQQAFTLTQVARSLRMSRATMQSILLSLVEAGYLYRRTDASYVLGRALHLSTARVNKSRSSLDVASQEMRALADDFDVIASALFIEGEDLVVREQAASVNHLGWFNQASPRRFPLRPWGGVFLLAMSEAETMARLGEDEPELNEEAKALMLTSLAFARLHGFIPVLIPDNEPPPEVRRRPNGRFVSHLEPQAEYPLRSLVAPVMGASHDVAFGIALFGFRPVMRGEEIMAVGRRLREACDRISTFVTGKRAQFRF